MGAWNIGLFENDEALDWLDELDSSNGADILNESFGVVFSVPYLEAPEGSRILCAAAAVAALLGSVEENEPEQLKLWVSKNASIKARDLAPTAVVCVNRVLADGSELKELWQENVENYSLWEHMLLRLRERLETA